MSDIPDDLAIEIITTIAKRELGPRPDPLREALDRYLANGVVDPSLFHTDPTYHAVVEMIRLALS